MRDSIFKVTSKKLVNKYCYSDEATFAIFATSLFDNVRMLDRLEELGYDLKKIKDTKVTKLYKNKGDTNLSQYNDDYEQYKKYKNILSYKNTDEIYNEIASYISQNKFNAELCVMIDSIYIREQNPEYKIDELSYKYIFGDLNKNSIITEYSLKSIKSYYNNLKLSYFINNETYLKILDSIHIRTFKDLKEANPQLINFIFARDMDYINYVFSMLAINPRKNYLDLINQIEDELLSKDKVYDIIVKRYGFYSNPMTLEEIGLNYNVTRERIRQLQELGDEIILSKGKEINLFIRYIFNSISQNKKYFKRIDLENEYGDKVSNFTKVFANVIEEDYCYSKKYDIFFLRGTLEDIIKEELEDMPLSITKDQYEEIDDLYKSIVDYNYSLRNNNLYIKLGNNLSDVYMNVVDELFPKGLNFTNENIEIINNELVNKYDIEPITAHALSAILSRLDYCYIDKGTMINRRYASSLDREIVDKILKYISGFENVVYYTSIYEAFKEELNDIGILNRYYLKGVLDRHLPKEYTTKRDYISVGESFTSSYDAILKEVNKSKGIIDIDEIKKKFPGVRDYVFLTCFSSIEDIVWYAYGKKFISLSKISFSSSFEETIKKEIEFLFKSLNSDVITSYKLYSRMKIMHKQLMDEHKFIDNQFFFHSIVNVLLKDKYYFRRPYISKSKDSLSNDVIIDNYVNSQSYFSLKTINNFVNKMNMRGLYSYLEYMISKSDEYVQINIDTCIRKENLFISNNDLEKIKQEVNFYINSFGPIDSKNITIFSYFPKLRYAWNKYLLVGILRTFLNEKYEIEYTDTMYNNTEFIIRRSK